MAEQRRKSPQDRLGGYIELVSAYVDGRVSAAELERRFYQAFGLEDPTMPEAEFLVLDRLFSDLDVFEQDPELREGVRSEGFESLDEVQLRQAAVEALAKLRALAADGGGAADSDDLA